MTPENTIETMVKDIRRYFNQHELGLYSTEIDKDGKILALEARRQFTKYYMNHISEFYCMLSHRTEAE